MPLILIVVVLALAGPGCSAAPVHSTTDPSGRTHELSGLASWYGARFQGRKTASGEPFDKEDLTAAHRTLPFGTIVRVVEPETRKSVVVRVNDRGPFTDGRVIDVSEAAARDLEMIEAGVIPVKLEVLEWGTGETFHGS